MDKAISAAEANRQFSRILREVRDGDTYVVTAHGRPVARISPVDRDTASRESAREAYFRELERRAAVDVGRWTRDELYER